MANFSIYESLRKFYYICPFCHKFFQREQRLFFFRALTFGGSKDLKCILNQNCLNRSVKNSNHGKPPHQKQSA